MILRVLRVLWWLAVTPARPGTAYDRAYWISGGSVR